jgi:ribonuclease BN (tRNA processing enzyme)
MKITLMGTNGWYATETGNTLSILIQGTEHSIVLDAGDGIHKLDQYLEEEKKLHLFLSHFHLDHLAGASCSAEN